LGHFINSVDVVYALAFVLISLVNRVNTNITWLIVRLRFTTLANGGFFRGGSGGATTALDLMLSIIGDDLGKEIAIAVSDLLIFDTERPGSTPQRQHVSAMIENQIPRLARAIKLMEQNIETPLSAAQIANQTFVSQRQLERDFKKVLGNSIAGYYSRLRIMFAQRLLTETGLSAKQIAMRAGYNSQASFNRSYKRILGKTPTDERKSLFNRG